MERPLSHMWLLSIYSLPNPNWAQDVSHKKNTHQTSET